MSFVELTCWVLDSFSFLNDAARIAMPNYERSDDDVVRARLRTLGVEEHRFTMESGAYPGSEWYIYDVGGSRSVVSLHILLFNQNNSP